jgi:hypothetical protein
MKLGAMRGLTAGICLMAAVSLTAATPAQAGEARSGGSAAKGSALCCSRGVTTSTESSATAR